MATEYRYTAIDGGGKLVQGTMVAEDAADLAQRLRMIKQVPIKSQAASAGLGRLLSVQIGGKAALSRSDVTQMTRELSTMLGAGQDLDRALRFLVTTAPSARARVVISALREAVRDGASLATALAAHGSSFSRLYIGLVRAGEAGGTLPATLERLATLMERDRALAATVQSALIYPVMLLLAATGAIVLLLTTVLPQFVPLFEQNGAHLPASTRLLIDAGDAVANWGLVALGVTVAAIVAVRQLLQQPGPRLAADRLLLRLPVLGMLTKEVMAARLCRTLGTLIGNGVPLMAAMTIVREVTTNMAGAEAVDAAAASAKGGAGLTGPLEQSGVFPVRMIHLLRLGEETAQLGAMALRAADIHEDRARTATQRLVSLLTPAITIVMGAVIAGIVSSLLMAMLSLNDLAS